MTPERIERERESFERFLFKKFELDYDDLEMRDVYFRRRKNGEYLNDTFTEKFDIWLARAAQSEWISVEDRLPEIGTRVLLCGRYEGKGIIAYCTIGYFDGKTYREHWGADINTTAAITHWQPLPTPPTTNPAA